MRPAAVFAVGLLSTLLAAGAEAAVVREIPVPETGPCIDPAEWAVMFAEADETLARLRAEGKLPEADPTAQVLFHWPLRPAPGFPDFGYHVISDFPDHDPRSPDYLLDYECGDRAYDGHNGTDYVLWPFPWYKMDHDQVTIVAAAAGVIFDKADGYYDHSCTPGGSSNKVAIRHDDGTRAWYLHMKTWSLTSKGVGESVEAGEYLGLVGSSGNSGIPHLHFDVRDADWNSFDPHDGPCNPWISSSWWADQRPYHDSRILAVMTHFAPPEFPECPQEEIVNIRDEFVPAETVYYGIYHRDLLAGQLVEHAVLRPDDSVADSGTYEITDPHYTASYAMKEYLLPESAPAGTWKISVDYQGDVYEHPFTVTGGGPGGAGAVPDGDEIAGTPLRMDKAAGDEIVLTWDASCVTGDSDYEIYGGDLGDFTGHEPRFCSTGGATSRTFAPLAGERYYLVVPTNGTQEGSYGTDSDGVERPVGVGACLGQVTAACP